MTSARRSIWTDAAITSLRAHNTSDAKPRHLVRAIFDDTGIVMTAKQVERAVRRYCCEPGVPRPRISTAWATPERVAVLRERWPEDEPQPVIRARLKALKGPPVPDARQISAWVSGHLGVKRTPAARRILNAWRDAGSVIPDFTPEPEPPPEPKKRTRPIPGWSGFVAPARPDVVRLVPPGTFKASGFTMLRGGARV